MSGWQKVCTLQDVEEGSPFGATIEGLLIGIFRVANQCYAISDVCSHEYALLSKGYQEGTVVECPLHQARFDLTTGKCLALPATQDLARFEVKIEDGTVYIMLDPVGCPKSV